MRTTSNREREIRKKAIQILIACGMSHRDIGKALNISPATVSHYREEIRFEY